MAETLVLAVKMQEIKMKILIADDHALFRDGLSMHLEQIAPSSEWSGNVSERFLREGMCLIRYVIARWRMLELGQEVDVDFLGRGSS